MLRVPRGQVLSSDGSTLYVGGKFDGAGDADARNLAAWDTRAQSWRPVCGAVGVSEVSPTDRVARVGAASSRLFRLAARRMHWAGGAAIGRMRCVPCCAECAKAGAQH